MSTEVYSWRVSSELKSDLEREARLRKTSLSAVLTMAVRDWLQRSAANVEGDQEQRKLHEAASKCLGALADGHPRRAQNARQGIRERLQRRNAR